jgi:flagellar motor switch protein FliN/FliY
MNDETDDTATLEETAEADTSGFDPEAAFAEAASAVSDNGSAAKASVNSEADVPAEDDDPWAAAMAEQQANEAAEDPEPIDMSPPKAVRDGSEQVFKPLGQSEEPGASRDLDIIMNIPVKLNVELGRTKISISKLLELTQGSVLELDGLAGDPMDILINGYLIAQGEVVVVEDKYGIRISNIINPSERVQKLNR